jgi:hypothetical protein
MVLVLAAPAVAVVVLAVAVAVAVVVVLVPGWHGCCQGWWLVVVVTDGSSTFAKTQPVPLLLVF